MWNELRNHQCGRLLLRIRLPEVQLLPSDRGTGPHHQDTVITEPANAADVEARLNQPVREGAAAAEATHCT